MAKRVECPAARVDEVLKEHERGGWRLVAALARRKRWGAHTTEMRELYFELEER